MNLQRASRRAQRSAWRAMGRLRQAAHNQRIEYRQPDIDLPIRHLISPLRYDVLVRQEFIRLMIVEWTTYEADIEAFLELARQQDYYIWFREVATFHIGIENPGDREALDRAFRRRVHKTGRLVGEFARTGYRPVYPITIQETDTPHTTGTGKTLHKRFHLVDGCHRLALLHMIGVPALPPTHYRLIPREEAPVDNTTHLVRTLGLSPARYYRFLSMSYGSGVAHDDRASLLDDVATNQPHLLEELRSVLAVDERELGQTRT